MKLPLPLGFGFICEVWNGLLEETRMRYWRITGVRDSDHAGRLRVRLGAQWAGSMQISPGPTGYWHFGDSNATVQPNMTVDTTGRASCRILHWFKMELVSGDSSMVQQHRSESLLKCSPCSTLKLHLDQGPVIHMHTVVQEAFLWAPLQPWGSIGSSSGSSTSRAGSANPCAVPDTRCRYTQVSKNS